MNAQRYNRRGKSSPFLFLVALLPLAIAFVGITADRKSKERAVDRSHEVELQRIEREQADARRRVNDADARIREAEARAAEAEARLRELQLQSRTPPVAPPAAPAGAPHSDDIIQRN